MKRLAFILFFLFHIGFIALNSVVMTRETHLDFFHKRSNALDAFLGDLIRTPFLLYYGRYTGTETGYGFFGFNVKSTGFVITEACGQKFTPTFQTVEAENRFAGLRSQFIDYIDYWERQKKYGNKMDTLRENYLDLVLKNIATFSVKGQSLPCDSVKTGYYLLELPFLAETTPDSIPAPTLFPLKSYTYAIHSRPMAQ